MPKDDRAFVDIVSEKAGSVMNQASKNMAAMMPTGELTRRKFHQSRDDLGEIARLQQKYGVEKVNDWGRDNSLRDEAEGT